jgi:K+-sensing histidine kinase KdpD
LATEHDRLVQENARLRGDLLTVATRISHDLRAPLGGITSTGEILREILAEKDPASAALMDSLFTSVDELTRLIKSVSAVTKASAHPRAKGKVRMGEIVSGVLERLESRTLKRRAAIVQPASWPEVDGVDSWLEVIWWNLLANALQHAGDSP